MKLIGRLIAVWEIVTGMIMAYMLLSPYLFPAPKVPSVWVIANAVVFLLSVISGFLLWLLKPSAVALSAVVQVLQLMSLTYNGSVYQFMGIFSVPLGFNFNNPLAGPLTGFYINLAALTVLLLLVLVGNKIPPSPKNDDSRMRTWTMRG